MENRAHGRGRRTGLLGRSSECALPDGWTAMALTGIGVGAVFGINPIQIVDGVPNQHTGTAISFYQLLRTVAYRSPAP